MSGLKIAVLLAKCKGVAFVSPEDAERVEAHWWRLDPSGYAATKIKGKYVSLHRFILRPGLDEHVDHVNRVKLDCRRSNLRIATPKQNMQNMRRRPSDAGYLGVRKRNSKWEARISDDAKYIYLGVFDTKEKAAEAYDSAAKQLRGEFAVLNFPS